MAHLFSRSLVLRSSAATLLVGVGCDDSEELTHGEHLKETGVELGECHADPTVEIATNHDHSLALSHEDLETDGDLVLEFGGTAEHTHSIVLTHEDRVDLLSLGSVIVKSKSSTTHEHKVTLACDLEFEESTE